MTLKIGDRVRSNPDYLSPEMSHWGNRTGTIIGLHWSSPAQGGVMFARVRMDDDGTTQNRVRVSMLLLATPSVWGRGHP